MLEINKHKYLGKLGAQLTCLSMAIDRAQTLLWMLMIKFK